MRSGHSRQETEFTDTHGEPKSVILIKFDMIANQIIKNWIWFDCKLNCNIDWIYKKRCKILF